MYFLSGAVAVIDQANAVVLALILKIGEWVCFLRLKYLFAFCELQSLIPSLAWCLPFKAHCHGLDRKVSGVRTWLHATKAEHSEAE